jgi:hypothetical protein
MEPKSLAVLLVLAATACAGEELQAVIETPSLDPPTPEGRQVAVVSTAPPAPPAPPPFSVPEGYSGEVDRAPLVATASGKIVLLRRLVRCEHVSGPVGHFSSPRVGSGTYTLPGSGGGSCAWWLDALDADGARLWTKPVSFGDPSTTLVGERLLTSRQRGLALLDVTTGETVASVNDPVLGREACLDAPHARVFVSDWDAPRNDAIVDLATMHIRPAGSERCPTRSFSNCHAQTSVACLESRDENRPGTIPVAGFYEAATLRTTTEEVLVGRRTQGRKLPMVVAIDPATHAKRWSAVVPPPDAQAQAAEFEYFPRRHVDLADGKLFIEYDAWSSHPHLAAFDIKNGARLWDVAIPAFVAFAPTADRVYLTDPQRMRVLDAKTGAEEQFP